MVLNICSLGMGVLYALRGHITRRVKIGRTSGELALRVASLQTGSPEILHVIGEDPRHGCEGEIHRALSEYRLHGEWFSHHVGDMITLEGFSTLVDRLTTYRISEHTVDKITTCGMFTPIVRRYLTSRITSPPVRLGRIMKVVPRHDRWSDLCEIWSRIGVQKLCRQHAKEDTDASGIP